MKTEDIRLNMRITGHMLKHLGACWPKRVQFQNAWPKGLLLRRSNLLKASKKRIGVAWFILKVLTWSERQRHRMIVKSMQPTGYKPIAVHIDAFVQVLRERGK